MFPSELYEVRTLLSDQIAACVMANPESCPTRGELPREIITDENLRRVLAFAVTAIGSHERMVDQVYRELGGHYAWHLAHMVAWKYPEGRGNAAFLRWEVDYPAFVWLVPWYAQRLREIEDKARRAEQLAGEAEAIASSFEDLAG